MCEVIQYCCLSYAFWSYLSFAEMRNIEKSVVVNDDSCQHLSLSQYDERASDTNRCRDLQSHF